MRKAWLLYLSTMYFAFIDYLTQLSAIVDHSLQVDFWRYLCTSLGIVTRLLTAFHTQTNGQTARINASMDEYRRAHINYLQDDWVQYLSLAEFAANNQESTTTAVLPFFATSGFKPRLDFELDICIDNRREEQASQCVRRLAIIHAHLRTQM